MSPHCETLCLSCQGPVFIFSASSLELSSGSCRPCKGAREYTFSAPYSGFTRFHHFNSFLSRLATTIYSVSATLFHYSITSPDQLVWNNRATVCEWCCNAGVSAMSYEFHLANPNHGQEVTADNPFNPGPVDPSAEERKRKLADALISSNPQLEVFQFNYDAVAASLGVSVDEARRVWRHLELNGPEDGNGIQITLWDTHATISVPFWHSGEDAVPVVREIWEYMRLLISVAGMQPFDPQLGRELNLETDFDAVLNRFAEGVSTLDATIDAEDD